MTSLSDRNFRRKLYACAIKNESDYDAVALLTYVGIPNYNNELVHTRLDLNVYKGKMRYLSERIITKKTHNVREVIEKIEVTLSNGKKMELTAPFDGVTDPTPDWHFVIENNQIRSAGPTPEFGK